MGIAYQLLDGYGGVILRLGFVNYLSKNYKNVLIIMYKYHENTVTYMLKHLKNIKYEFVCWQYSEEEEKIKKNLPENMTIHQYWDEYFKKKYPKYNFTNQEHYKKWDFLNKLDHFNIYRNENDENLFFNNIIKENKEYILYEKCDKNKEFNKLMVDKSNNKHYNDLSWSKDPFQDHRTNRDVHDIYLNSKKFYINLHNLSKNMIETYKLLDNAKEIHLVPGPYALLITLLLKKNKNFLKNTKVFLHQYTRMHYWCNNILLECNKFIKINKKNHNKNLSKKN